MKMRHDPLVPHPSHVLEILQTFHDMGGDDRLTVPGLRSPDKAFSDAGFIAALRRMGYAKEEMRARVSANGFNLAQ